MRCLRLFPCAPSAPTTLAASYSRSFPIRSAARIIFQLRRTAGRWAHQLFEPVPAVRILSGSKRRRRHLPNWHHAVYNLRISKADCKARGMYSKDSSNRTTQRFGGNTFDPPPTYKSKSFLDSKTVTGVNSANLVQFKEFIPEIFGAGWSQGLVLNVLGDGNSTRCEVAVCYGWIGSASHDDSTVGISRVLVNGGGGP
jgi:hypothetical protein